MTSSSEVPPNVAERILAQTAADALRQAITMTDSASKVAREGDVGGALVSLANSFEVCGELFLDRARIRDRFASAVDPSLKEAALTSWDISNPGSMELLDIAPYSAYRLISGPGLDQCSAAERVLIDTAVRDWEALLSARPRFHDFNNPKMFGQALITAARSLWIVGQGLEDRARIRDRLASARFGDQDFRDETMRLWDATYSSPGVRFVPWGWSPAVDEV